MPLVLRSFGTFAHLEVSSTIMDSIISFDAVGQQSGAEEEC